MDACHKDGKKLLANTSDYPHRQRFISEMNKNEVKAILGLRKYGRLGWRLS